MEDNILRDPKCSYRTDGYFPNRFQRSFYQLKIAFISTYLPILLIRFLIKHLYFGYKRYLFEDKKNYSLLTKTWFIFHRLFSKLSPQLNSCEGLLPTLPLPSLKDTIAGYLNSVEPLLDPHKQYNDEEILGNLIAIFIIKDEDEFTDVKKMAQNFLNNEAWKLQGLAWLYWCFVNNYVTDVWEKFAYLYSRKGVMINSSVAHLDVFTCIPANQAIRAAHVVFWETLSMLSVDRQSLRPVRYHLEIYCGTTRHIAVYHLGCIYKLDVFDENGHILSLKDLTEIFSELLSRDENVGEMEGWIAALTTDSREQWCLNRRRFFLENTLNRASLAVIESAIFYLVLDDACYNYDQDQPEMLEVFLKNMLTGDGSNRWADKSLNYVVGANGRCGGTTEHSMKAEIARCYANYQKQINDVDIACIVFRDFGKGFIKEAGISPDAFLQMAIQLASFKDQGRFSLTYESISARFYANSRTETLRSVTKESCAFVKSMINTESSNEECLKLLKEAVEVHTFHSKECLTGKGIDRHLLVLHIISKITGINSPLLDYYIAQPWELSTSQTPNVTRQVDEDEHPDASWFGGGFEAACKDGYGISYRFAGNHSICINIASYKSAENTDSHRFKQYLIRSMHDISAILKHKIS
ncbi:Carnitine O-palmitoyltransferase 1, liver isoform [Dirofilaria immitis]|nr:Carnitine O-palmitoyltransferase 1, liver isoform [Dirofilaria immitis]